MNISTLDWPQQNQQNPPLHSDTCTYRVSQGSQLQDGTTSCTWQTMIPLTDTHTHTDHLQVNQHLCNTILLTITGTQTGRISKHTNHKNKVLKCSKTFPCLSTQEASAELAAIILYCVYVCVCAHSRIIFRLGKWNLSPHHTYQTSNYTRA